VRLKATTSSLRASVCRGSKAAACWSTWRRFHRPARGPSAFRMPVQYVIRPPGDFRGYAGQIAAGFRAPGDEVMVLPSGQGRGCALLHLRRRSGARLRADVGDVVPGRSDRYQPRGHAADPARPPVAARRWRATLVWMSETPLALPAPVPGEAHFATGVRGSDAHGLAARPSDAGTGRRRRAAPQRDRPVEFETHRPLFRTPTSRIAPPAASS